MYDVDAQNVRQVLPENCPRCAKVLTTGLKIEDRVQMNTEMWYLQYLMPPPYLVCSHTTYCTYSRYLPEWLEDSGREGYRIPHAPTYEVLAHTEKSPPLPLERR